MSLRNISTNKKTTRPKNEDGDASGGTEDEAETDSNIEGDSASKVPTHEREPIRRDLEENQSLAETAHNAPEEDDKEGDNLEYSEGEIKHVLLSDPEVRKRTIFLFTYDSDNYLLELILGNKEGLFTRGRSIKTWEVVLTEFNAKFHSSILQTRTINNRFKLLGVNLEKKLINEPNNTKELNLNENERLLMELNEYINTKNSTEEIVGGSMARPLQLEPKRKIPKRSSKSEPQYVQPTPESNFQNLKQQHQAIPLQFHHGQSTGIGQPPMYYHEGSTQNHLLEQLIDSQNENNKLLAALRKEVHDMKEGVDFKLNSFLSMMNGFTETTTVRLNKLHEIIVSTGYPPPGSVSRTPIVSNTQGSLPLPPVPGTRGRPYFPQSHNYNPR